MTTKDLKLPLQIHELGDLFEAVQLQNVLGDGKAFPDCIAKRDLLEISKDFQKNRNTSEFELKKFVLENFSLPSNNQIDFVSDSKVPVSSHINSLWKFLTRTSQKENSSLIPLPNPYVVPGGRFGECYYWDSYFTMLGLQKSGRQDLVKNMVDNFVFLIDTIGYIPNGNRTYFIGRSQPPFFSLMVKLLSEKSEEVFEQYLPQLEKEYKFWMTDKETLTESNPSIARVVLLNDGSVLNRYWDSNNTPRPESYKEDVELAHNSKQSHENLYRNLRAAAESGWDFSSRWFAESGDFGSIHTTEIIPVDLNCLLLHLEQLLSEAYRYVGNKTNADKFLALAQQRKLAIRKFCWSEMEKFYFDYDFKSNRLKESFTLAGFFPLFFQVATPDQATQMATHLESEFLKSGGLTTTLEFSGQQWDAPNGWAPLQWICYQGLLNYGFDELAERVKKCWLSSNEAVFRKTGKMTEKYDVWNDHADASGGEYPNQDGFGWTNGVYLAMSQP